MKRSLLATLASGALAAVVVIGLQKTGLLLRPESAILDWLFPAGAPNDGLGPGNYLLIAGLGLATAWTMLQVAELPRRIALLLLLLVEIAGAAFVLSFGRIAFQPLPGLLVAFWPRSSQRLPVSRNSVAGGARPRLCSRVAWRPPRLLA